MYKYVLNLVIKISLMFAQYFEYYAIILRGAVFLWTQCIFSVPAAHAEYSATNVIAPVGAVTAGKTTMRYLPVRPLHFAAGAKISPLVYIWDPLISRRLLELHS